MVSCPYWNHPVESEKCTQARAYTLIGGKTQFTKEILAETAG